MSVGWITHSFADLATLPIAKIIFHECFHEVLEDEENGMFVIDH